MIIGFMLSMLIAVDEPIPAVPPPVITPIRPAPPAPLAPPIPALPDGVKNLVSLFSTDDYPVEAMRLGEEGTAQVRLMVTTDGRVGQCEVMSSSGSQVLDRATCEILQRRARFKPALDNRGRPAIDYFTQRVRWELPVDLFEDEYARATIDLNPASVGRACIFEERVNLDVTCEPLTILREEILATPGLPRTGTLVIEMGQRIGKGEALLHAGVGPGLERLSFVAVTLAIGADGRVNGCTAAFPEIDAADVEEECHEVERWKFEPFSQNGNKQSPRYLTTYRVSYLRN